MLATKQSLRHYAGIAAGCPVFTLWMSQRWIALDYLGKITRSSLMPVKPHRPEPVFGRYAAPMSFLSRLLLIWLSISYAQPGLATIPAPQKFAEPYISTGATCQNCNISPQASWYFDNEIITLTPTADSAAVTLPAWLHNAPDIDDDMLLWIASPQTIDKASLDPIKQQLDLPSGQQFLFKTIGKIPQNQAYWNTASATFFSERGIRLRGTIEGDSFVARTVWPLDFAISNFQQLALNEQEDLQTLVQADDGGVSQPHQSRLLWERQPGAALQSAGKPVLGLMLNGAQGDDHEALAGHFAVVTGQFQADGSYHDWLVNNFYNLDIISEKGILAAVTPMDNYLADLNAGQNYYRPSYMLFATLTDPQAVVQFQQSISQVMNHFYRHSFIYNHADANCSGISIDTLRSLGWNVPQRGSSGYLKAIGAYFYMAIMEADLHAARQIYDYLTTETTRLLPAVAFDAVGNDLLQLASGQTSRTLTGYEQALEQQIEAIWFVRIPQIPSSRALGAAPVYSFNEYLETAPDNRDDWVTIELAEQELPAELQQTPVNPVPFPIPLPVIAILLGVVSFIAVLLHRALKKQR